MNYVYLITGPAGVGKSTISKELANRKEKSALIEGDDVYHQVISGYVPAWKEGNHLNIFWEICLNIIKIYLENGYNVVFNYIINPETLEKIKQELKDYNIVFVCLLTTEETLLKRDSERTEDYQMKERCLVLLNNFKNKKIDSDNILYTDNLSISQIVDEIQNNKKYILKNNKIRIIHTK